MEISKLIESLYWTKLKMALFYQSDYALRFDTTTDGLDIGTLKYFDTAVERAITLFLDIFEDAKLITVVVHTSGDKDEIKLDTWELATEICDCIKLSKSEVYSELLPYINDSEQDDMVTVRTVISINKSDFDYYELIKRICRQDIRRTPCIDDEVFILNDELNIAYNFYDDRGVDIAASSGELLQEIYKLRKDWLYDYEDKYVIKL